MGDAQKGYLYPDHTQNDCGALTAACEQFFIEEGCFYECDKNLGKWRKHDDCSQDEANDNGWEIEGVPIKASYCDAWYTACSGPNNCASAPPPRLVAPLLVLRSAHVPRSGGAAGCRRIDEVYTSGKHICETMWGGSFKYENDTSADAYVMSFTEGATNPNNGMFSSKIYPTAARADPRELTKSVEDGCPTNWHVNDDPITTFDTLQCSDNDCTAAGERRLRLGHRCRRRRAALFKPRPRHCAIFPGFFAATRRRRSPPVGVAVE